jgi:hypothetical protein
MSVETVAQVPELSGRFVTLRPLLPSDAEWCYALMCGPAGAQWSYRGRTPSPEQVASELWNGVFAQFVVVSRDAGERAGLVGLTNVSAEAGRAHAFAVASPDASPLVVQGFGLMCAWAYRQFSFERIYLEAAEFNIAAFASLGEAAIVEGRLRNYEFWRGRYWDRLIMSMSAQAFTERFGATLDFLRTGDAEPGPSALTELVAELLPLDSLGAVEVLCALEEHVGYPVGHQILTRIDALTAEAVTAQLVEAAPDFRLAGIP